MKKITIALVAVISAILLCLGLVACGGSDVAGKTYVFDDMKIVSGEAPEGSLDMMKEWYKDMEMTFNDDGTVEQKMGDESDTGYYVQEGSKVYFFESKADADSGDKDKAEVVLEVSGSKLETEFEMEGLKVKITYKKK